MTKALRQFQLDILAYEQNLGQMVQTGAFIDEYLQVDASTSIWQPDEPAMTTTRSTTSSSQQQQQQYYSRHQVAEKGLKVE